MYQRVSNKPVGCPATCASCHTDWPQRVGDVGKIMTLCLATRALKTAVEKSPSSVHSTRHAIPSSHCVSPHSDDRWLPKNTTFALEALNYTHVPALCVYVCVCTPKSKVLSHATHFLALLLQMACVLLRYLSVDCSTAYTTVCSLCTGRYWYFCGLSRSIWVAPLTLKDN